MSSTLQIHNVPDDLRRVLQDRAAARGTSLNRYLLELIGREVGRASAQHVERPTVRDVLDRAARRPEHSTASAVSSR